MKQNRKTEKFLVNRKLVDHYHNDFNAIAEIDEHAINGTYLVRSLYFDNDKLEALKDRMAQKEDHKKYRIRYYNHDPSFMRLEEKVKHDDIGTKLGTAISVEEVKRILNGDIKWLAHSGDPLKEDFYAQIQKDHIKPMVIVEYQREPYTQPKRDIRMTLDYDIKASKDLEDFFEDDLPLDNLIEDQAVIEIKWPDKLPNEIQNIITCDQLSPVNFSKYTSTYDYIKSH